MNLPSSYSDRYWSYLQHLSLDLTEDQQSKIQAMLDQTQWEEPQSALDLNNCAVVALIEAEQADDLTSRELYLEVAIAALNEGIQHPLCAAHLALVHSLIGETVLANRVAFSTFINTLQTVFINAEKSEDQFSGLVYIPPIDTDLTHHQKDFLKRSLLLEANSYHQSILLLGEVLWRSHPVFYNSIGLRLLTLAVQLLPGSALLKLKLGISNLFNNQEEGLLYLHQAAQLFPDQAAILQALYLAYRDLGQVETAQTWLTMAHDRSQQQSQPEIDWVWGKVGLNSPITYVPFNREILLAVEASLRSIVTLVLLGSGNWFEAEMEFWCDSLQPGMTVIDVGANVGVYTFSAAQKVGPQGKVFAIEPFSGCVRCLEETCRINQIDWVTVCAGAASDRNGNARLSLHQASELNELVVDETSDASSETSEEVACFTLDSLVDQEQLARVDFLKIDAENHEMAVLQGSQRILAEFSPTILYENIAGVRGANLPVAKFLTEHGYDLFHYQPYLKKLIPVKTLEELQNKLNIIAIPQKTPAT